jgi:hypothetical protein
MTQYGLVAKRLKRKKDLPDRAKIYCINHIWLEGYKFKIYVRGGNHFENRTELYLFNEMLNRWYQIIYKPFRPTRKEFERYHGADFENENP